MRWEVSGLKSHVDKAAVTWGNRSDKGVSSWWALQGSNRRALPLQGRGRRFESVNAHKENARSEPCIGFL